MKKIAIFGGTFNPVHNGHIIGMQKVFDTLLFDEVWMMPSNIPPYKRNEAFSSKDRLSMCEIASDALGFTKVNQQEMNRKEISYTYDTLCQLREKSPEKALYWVIGYDNLDSIEKWYKSECLLKEFGLVVINRGGFSEDEASFKISRLQKKYETNIIKVKMPNIEISSTEIRERIKKKQLIVGFTLPKIIEYIKVNHLYID